MYTLTHTHTHTSTTNSDIRQPIQQKPGVSRAYFVPANVFIFHGMEKFRHFPSVMGYLMKHNLHKTWCVCFIGLCICAILGVWMGWIAIDISMELEMCVCVFLNYLVNEQCSFLASIFLSLFLSLSFSFTATPPSCCNSFVFIFSGSILKSPKLHWKHHQPSECIAKTSISWKCVIDATMWMNFVHFIQVSSESLNS